MCIRDRFKRIEILLNILFWGFMIWIFVFGNGTMDVVSSEIIKGKEHKILVRNLDKLYATLIAQFFFILLFYVILYLIHKLWNPKAVKFFVLKSIGLIFGNLLVYVIVIRTIFFPNNATVLKGSNIVFMNVFYVAVAVCYGFIKKWMQYEREKSAFCLLYTSPSPRDKRQSRMPSSA